MCVVCGVRCAVSLVRGHALFAEGKGEEAGPKEGNIIRAPPADPFPPPHLSRSSAVPAVPACHIFPVCHTFNAHAPMYKYNQRSNSIFQADKTH